MINFPSGKTLHFIQACVISTVILLMSLESQSICTFVLVVYICIKVLGSILNQLKEV